MPQFGATSTARLATCDPRLQAVMRAVVVHFDCMIIEGHRPEVAQNAAYAAGKSKVKWPNSTHNTLPSTGVDAAPWPLDWNDSARFHYFAGVVMATARHMGVKLRWGGDWNRNTQVKDETFRDLVHFELDD